MLFLIFIFLQIVAFYTNKQLLARKKQKKKLKTKGKFPTEQDKTQFLLQENERKIHQKLQNVQ